ncbi:translation factor [Atractiella rhizophila]|nr:translation factor [Atractiella rhizophila]
MSPPKVLAASSTELSYTFASPPLSTPKLTFSSTETSTSLAHAADLLRQNRLVAFPTETVYGLGGSALSTEACQKIFRAKGRPSDNPLIVHVSSLEMVHSLVPSDSLHPIHVALMERFWPGPLTIVFAVPSSASSSTSSSGIQEVSPLVRGGLKNHSIALRMPSHPLALALIHLSNLPLAAPSANKSGRPSTTRAEHVVTDYSQGVTDQLVDAVLDGGPCGVGVESTVVDVHPSSSSFDPQGAGTSTPKRMWDVRVLRAGGVGVEDLRSCFSERNLLGVDGGVREVTVFGKEESGGTDESEVEEMRRNPRTPGMKYRHYAPDHSRVIAFRTSPLSIKSEERVRRLFDHVPNGRERKKATFLLLRSSPLLPLPPSLTSKSQVEARVFEDVSHLSRELYESLRSLDGKVDYIYVEEVPSVGVGLAVMERVLKASGERDVIEI